MNAIQRVNRDIIVRRGWHPGSSLEDTATCMLSRVFKRDEVKQQLRIGRYKADYAWPDIKVILEIDGWHHRSPVVAAKDAERDAWLRSRGWVIFRVDDVNGPDVMTEQLVRVCRIVKILQDAGERG